MPVEWSFVGARCCEKERGVDSGCRAQPDSLAPSRRLWSNPVQLSLVRFGEVDEEEAVEGGSDEAEQN